jgi:hypothetical protein
MRRRLDRSLGITEGGAMADTFIRESGDLLRFSTVEDAADYMEPIDVRNGEWTAWDSAGQVLTPAVDTRERGRGLFRSTVEHVVLRPTGEHDPEGLLDAVREQLQVLGADARSTLQEALAVWRSVDERS